MDDKYRKMSNDRKMYCHDCQCFVDPYMVKDQVWEQAIPDYSRLARYLYQKVLDEMGLRSPVEVRNLGPEEKKEFRARSYAIQLCFSCLQERLERPLEISDFTEAPINDKIRLGFNMGEASRAIPTSEQSDLGIMLALWDEALEKGISSELANRMSKWRGVGSARRFFEEYGPKATEDQLFPLLTSLLHVEEWESIKAKFYGRLLVEAIALGTDSSQVRMKAVSVYRMQPWKNCSKIALVKTLLDREGDQHTHAYLCSALNSLVFDGT